ncbi:DUF2931 family protein [Marinobacter sp.]|uniref:DUF2931 family protein n=1 Tax=Marinobacter sp. TaxID=50741 RepID=UPI0034A2C747
MIRKFIVILAFTILSSACSSDQGSYPYTIAVAGGPTGWPIWLEEIVMNDAIHIPGGINGYGFDQAPPNGSRVILGTSPVPARIDARWFSHRTLDFYKASISMPDEFHEQLEGWYQRYPPPEFGHYFIIGFSGKGEVTVWWRATCLSCDNEAADDFTEQIVSNRQADKVAGDAEEYRAQVEQFVDKGTFTSPW